MAEFVGALIGKLDQDSARILLVFLLFVFVYLGVLVILYVPTLLFVHYKNRRDAEKAGVIVIHTLEYSWLKGVRLTPTEVYPKKEKGEPLLEKGKEKPPSNPC